MGNTPPNAPNKAQANKEVQDDLLRQLQASKVEKVTHVTPQRNGNFEVLVDDAAVNQAPSKTAVLISASSPPPDVDPVRYATSQVYRNSVDAVGRKRPVLLTKSSKPPQPREVNVATHGQEWDSNSEQHVEEFIKKVEVRRKHSMLRRWASNTFDNINGNTPKDDHYKKDINLKAGLWMRMKYHQLSTRLCKRTDELISRGKETDKLLRKALGRSLVLGTAWTKFSNEIQKLPVMLDKLQVLSDKVKTVRDKIEQVEALLSEETAKTQRKRIERWKSLHDVRITEHENKAKRSLELYKRRLVERGPDAPEPQLPAFTSISDDSSEASDTSDSSRSSIKRSSSAQSGMLSSGSPSLAFGAKRRVKVAVVEEEFHDSHGFPLTAKELALNNKYNHVKILGQRRKAWDELFGFSGKRSGTEVEDLVKKYGVPSEYRKRMWPIFAKVRQQQDKHGRDYYQELCQQEPKRIHAQEIETDLQRTYPSNKSFGLHVDSLGRILRAYAVHNSEVGYAQSMNFVCGMILIEINDEETAFWIFLSVIDNILPSYYLQSLLGARVDQRVLEHLMEEHAPDTWAALHDREDNNYNYLPIMSIPWLLCLYCSILPTRTTLCVIDNVLYYGRDFSVAAALAIYKIFQKDIVKIVDGNRGDSQRRVRLLVSNLYDRSKLLQVAHSYFSKIPKELFADLRGYYETVVKRETAESKERREKYQEFFRVDRDADKYNYLLHWQVTCVPLNVK